MQAGAARDGDGIRGLLVAYRPPAGVADEILDGTGGIRPVWRRFLGHLAGIAPTALERQFARGDQYLNDAGVFFRQYGATGSTERAWPLSHIPVIVDEAEWAGIEAGLSQRADLLERVCADLYGEARLIREGHLPAELIARNPEWLRPMVGVRPASGHYLHFVAFEIGRNPDGTWFVLGDRTQAPSGAGFALENRLATARVFPDFYPGAGVRRVAPFFKEFRDSLQALQGGADNRVAILTPGPLNDTYFEHTYIARYMGFMLLEGEDLTVENGQAMVRTVGGSRPVNVVWRRVDSAFCDPLELDERSRLGTPGLMGAVRAGSVTVVNAIGSGILETRALLAFLPRIAERLTGAPLAMPNIATWWCGQAAERAYVKENIGRMMIGPALSNRLPFDLDATTALGGTFRTSARRGVSEWLDAEGSALVGQEAVSLSTTPAFVDGALAPRPMTLRVFLARRPGGGWAVMPGGYARIGRTEDPTALAMQRGGSVADVWVTGTAPHPEAEPLAPPRPFVRVQPGVLPARAADNLYWLGRYVERTEGLVRLLRSYHLRLAEAGPVGTPVAAQLEAHLAALGLDPADPMPRALAANVTAAAGCASKVRDRFSVDGWAALADLQKTVAQLTETVAAGDDAARAMGVLLRKLAGFAGLVQDNMYRFTGWRFLTAGRAVENADRMADVLIHYADPDAPDGALDLAVELGDSVMSHRRRYAVATNRMTVIDLLALDRMNPQSVVHQVSSIRAQVDLLPGASEGGHLSALSRRVLEAETALVVATPEEMTGERLAALRGDLAAISDLITAAYLR